MHDPTFNAPNLLTHAGKLLRTSTWTFRSSPENVAYQRAVLDGNLAAAANHLRWRVIKLVARNGAVHRKDMN
jgi:hypothetical protein